MALTGKKRKFALAILAGKSNKDAAIAAGYSVATASQSGSRLVKEKDIASYIVKCIAEKEKALTPADGSAVQEDKSTGFDLKSALMYSDPKDFLVAVMNDAEADQKLRTDAAKALMPFVHQRKGEGGKKEQQHDAAKKVASRFAPSAPPKLVAAGGRKV